MPEYPVTVPAYESIDPAYQSSPGRVIASWPNWREVDLAVTADQPYAPDPNATPGPGAPLSVFITRSNGQGREESFEYHPFVLGSMGGTAGVADIANFLSQPAQANYPALHFKVDSNVNHSPYPDATLPGDPSKLTLLLDTFWDYDTTVISGKLSGFGKYGFTEDSNGDTLFVQTLKAVRFEYSTLDKVVSNSPTGKSLVTDVSHLQEYTSGDSRPLIRPNQYYTPPGAPVSLTVTDFATHSFLYYVPENIRVGAVSLFCEARDIPIQPVFQVALSHVSLSDTKPGELAFQLPVQINGINDGNYSYVGQNIPRGWYIASIQRQGAPGLVTLTGMVPPTIYGFPTSTLPNVRVYDDAGQTGDFSSDHFNTTPSTLVNGVVPRLFLGIEGIN